MGVREINSNDRSLTGRFFSEKMDSEVAFESSLEKDFFTWCEFNTGVEEFIYQPLSIEYVCEKGVHRTYTPDALVVFNDSRETWLVEVKYREDFKIQFKENKAKFRAAVKYCVRKSWKFIVIDESIRTEYLRNVKFLLNYSGKKVDDEVKGKMISCMKEMKEFTPQKFIESFAKTDYVRGVTLRYFWILVCQRELICDLRLPIGMNTEFVLSESHYVKY